MPVYLKVIRVMEMKWIITTLLVINILGFLLMWYDKRQAINGGWRVPESRLFLTALLGRAVGILLGMRMFRHKTKHWSFRIAVPLHLLLSILWMTAYSMWIEGEANSYPYETMMKGM